MRQVFVILILITSFLTSSFIPLADAYTMMPDFIYEIGLKFYQEGRYAEALTEFRKTLLLEPDYEPARKFIRIIEGEEAPPKEAVTYYSRGDAINEALDLMELKKEGRPPRAREAVTPFAPEIKLLLQKITPYKSIKLDENFSQIPQPIEVEQGKNLLIQGNNITRFLITNPEIVAAEKKGVDEVLFTGKEIGYTYAHIWDDNGRWTVELLGVFPKPEVSEYEELLRREEETARNFKLRYGIDWSSYESGPNIDNLSRSNYAWAHILSLSGPTPYGNFNSSASIRAVSLSTDLSYLTMNLTNGVLGHFEKFNIYGFDITPKISNLAFGGTSLRGVMLNSPAFNQKLDYTVFWGTDGGGRFGDLSPGLTKGRESYVEGVNVGYFPTKKQSYRATIAHGYGKERFDYLKDYGYDLTNNWTFGNWKLGYELASDSDVFAHILASHHNKSNLNLGVEFRDIAKEYFSINGAGWRQGEIGVLANLNYSPYEKIAITSNLNVYKDRLYPAEDNPDRLNEDFTLGTTYQINNTASLNAGYTLQNYLGRVSQYRYNSQNLSINKTFKLLRDVYTFFSYSHQDNDNYASPASSYLNDRLYSGIRLNLIGELYYYINKELNWLKEKNTKTTSNPHALETGLSWSSRLSDSPFYTSLNFTYRDEEDTVSNLSLLSGEDYIEGYSQLSYRPQPDIELYGALRARNVWADSPTVSKRIEMSFNAGMRYLWDSGFHWDAVGNIEGYVFKDLNSDGLWQSDEPPVEGIRLYLGKDKKQISDIFGYYIFKQVKARKGSVNVDISTLPGGFVLTVPDTQEANIRHRQTARLDFGISSRSEIYGIVFEDKNDNGAYDQDDLGVSGVVIVLDSGKKTTTDEYGRYSFRTTTAGKHTLKLIINTIPIKFLPQTSIYKDVELAEGMSFIHNIPLQKINPFDAP